MCARARSMTVRQRVDEASYFATGGLTLCMHVDLLQTDPELHTTIDEALRLHGSRKKPVDILAAARFAAEIEDRHLTIARWQLRTPVVRAILHITQKADRRITALVSFQDVGAFESTARLRMMRFLGELAAVSTVYHLFLGDIPGRCLFRSYLEPTELLKTRALLDDSDISGFASDISRTLNLSERWLRSLPELARKRIKRRELGLPCGRFFARFLKSIEPARLDLENLLDEACSGSTCY